MLKRYALAVPLAACFFFAYAGAAKAAQGDCGQPKSQGSTSTASDALAVLVVAVGIGSCDLCVCDVNDNGAVSASDAFTVLKSAVGSPVTLNCPSCMAGSTSTTITTTTTTTTSTTTTTTIPLPVDAEFSFDGTLTDESGQFTAVNYLLQESGFLINSGLGFQAFTTTPEFATESETFVILDYGEFIGLPRELSERFDADQLAQIDLRFRFQEPAVPLSGRYFRIVLGTNSGDHRDLGFQIRIECESDRCELVFFIGDGLFSDMATTYGFSLSEVVPDTWIDLSMIFRLRDSPPRIGFLVNGGPFNAVMANPAWGDRLELLIAHLEGGPGPYPQFGGDQVQLFLGGMYYDDRFGDPFRLDFDSFSVDSPKAVGDNAVLRGILTSFAGHVNGDTPLGESELRALAQDFMSMFSGDWNGIETEARAYLAAYEAANGPIFATGEHRSPASLQPESLLTYYLQQWIFDNLYTQENVASIAGLKFQDADAYPGVADDAAPRVDGQVEVDATYHTDPGILLNGQETVFRPTGYYAAPGEAVTVHVDPTVVAAGLQVRIGIQRFDLEQSWSAFNRFPRISNVFDIDSTSTLIANPFGGGIYVVVPDGTDLGDVTVGINGAVRMPMYSTLDLEGHSQDQAQFNAETGNWYVPWFELHSPNFSATMPMNAATFYADPAPPLALFNDALDAINRMAGRPLSRFRSEWLASDRQVPIFGTALPASYPLFPGQELGSPGENWGNDYTYFSPMLYLRPDFFDQDMEFAYHRDQSFILWHEWGHLHNLPTLEFQEQESNVHLLGAIVFNQVMGADLDTALSYSGFQQYNRDEAALDTMFSPNWQIGERLSFDDWDNEVRYQTRSWARLVEIVGLYDWDALGAIHNAFYQRGVDQGAPVNYGLADDDFIETASMTLNLNLAPIFEFWGVPPSAELKVSLSPLPLPMGFLDRLNHYRTLVPLTLAEFVPIHDNLIATTGSRGRWDYWLANFTPATAQQILDRIDSIRCYYYSECSSQPDSDAGARNSKAPS